MRAGHLRTLVGAVLATLAALAALGAGGSTDGTLTWSVAPTVLRHLQPATASGIVPDGRAGQLVTIQGLPCDQPTWRDVAEAITGEGGAWSVEVRPGVSGQFRAVAGDARSESVRLQQRPFVYFGHRRGGKFSVAIQAQRPFWHRKAAVERFDAARRTWLVVRRVLLTGQQSSIGDPYIYTSSDPFKLDVPRGTLLRATLPLPQARPCYLGGYSAMIRR